MPSDSSIESRFWPKVSKSDGCWEWQGTRRGNGYGGLHVIIDGERRFLAAHRVSYQLHKGPIPDGLVVMHSCDNRRCVNPNHLSVGTMSDNMQDAAQKGRIVTIGQSLLTHCKRGHEFNEVNTYRDGEGHRRCKQCRLEYQREVRGVTNSRRSDFAPSIKPPPL